MNASTENASPGEETDEGWDETVFVWNATVARIPAPATEPDSADDVAGVEGGNAPPHRQGSSGP
jgi:hypothetical protein